MATFVLVPGAWMGAWAWKKILRPLRLRCHNVYPITLTGMGDRAHLENREIGVETAIRDIINVIEYEDLTNVVLVGHSFAGKLIAAVQDRIPKRIRMLMFIDATRPRKTSDPQGGSDEWSDLERSETVKIVNNEGDGWKFPVTNDILKEIGSDLKGENFEWFSSKITPIPLKLLFDPITVSENYDRCSKSYVLCTKGGDDVEQIIKTGLDGKYRVIESGHWPMITRPEELVESMIELSE